MRLTLIFLLLYTERITHVLRPHLKTRPPCSLQRFRYSQLQTPPPTPLSTGFRLAARSVWWFSCQRKRRIGHRGGGRELIVLQCIPKNLRIIKEKNDKRHILHARIINLCIPPEK